jgi:hypothetical protein
MKNILANILTRILNLLPSKKKMDQWTAQHWKDEYEALLKEQKELQRTILDLTNRNGMLVDFIEKALALSGNTNPEASWSDLFSWIEDAQKELERLELIERKLNGTTTSNH